MQQVETITQNNTASQILTVEYLYDELTLTLHLANV